MTDISRRRAIQLSGASLVAALAGCSSSPSDSTTVNTEKFPNTSTRTTTEQTTTEEGTTGETTTSQPNVRFVERGDGIVRVRMGESGDVRFSDSNARTAIQHAIDAVMGGGVVELDAGVFRIQTDPIVVKPGVEFRGAGVSNTTIKLSDGVNQEAGPHLAVPKPATGVVVSDFELDGNESGNRDVEPFPNHPPAHGILMYGEGNVLENVAVHDTIGSNIVVNGTRCRLRDLRLRNSASDHWLYVSDAEHCTISNVTASGFARGSGIVFSVTQNTCRHNTLSDVEIKNATTTPKQHENSGVRGRFPVFALNFRDVGTARGNVAERVSISSPNHERGHQVFLGQQDATLRNLEYRGPVGGWRTFLRLGSPKRGSPGTEVTDLTVRPSKLVSHGPHRPTVVRSESNDVTLSGLEATGCDGADLRGVRFDGRYRQIENNSLRDSTLETDGPVIVADGTEHPIRGLVVENVEDVSGAGVKTSGEVSFEQRGLD